jgi:hypothetical protein
MAKNVREKGSRKVDWTSDEGKQATERLNHFLKHIDKTVAPEGYVRTPVPLGTDENGEPFGIIVWKKP